MILYKYKLGSSLHPTLICVIVTRKSVLMGMYTPGWLSHPSIQRFPYGLCTPTAVVIKLCVLVKRVASRKRGMQSSNSLLISTKSQEDADLQMPELCYDHRGCANGGGANTPIYHPDQHIIGISANLRMHAFCLTVP